MNRRLPFSPRWGLRVLLGWTLAGISGCADQATESVVITSDTSRDIEHQHKHFHGGDHDHDHDHDGFSGAHDHGHAHGHRHADPPHGGRLVGIEHSHHRPGATLAHIEVMPLIDDEITIHLLSESKEGDWHAFRTDVTVIWATIQGVLDADADSEPLEFRSVVGDGSASTFVAKIPPDLASRREWVISGLELPGNTEPSRVQFDLNRHQGHLESSSSLD